MAKSRTGAPLWAQIIRKACKLSHTAGFRGALATLLGTDYADIIAAWDVFCVLFETFLGKDDWPLEVDFTTPFAPGDVS